MRGETEKGEGGANHYVYEPYNCGKGDEQESP